MPRYIDADALIKKVFPYDVVDKKSYAINAKTIYEEIQKAPTVNVAESKAIEQIKWERDTAIEQLKSYGVGFGEKADVAEVKHGEWMDKPTGAYSRMQSWCTVCGKHSGVGGIESNRHKPYCPNCGAKMDGGKTE